MRMRSKYTTAQLLRFPVLFGSILGVFVTGFMYRKIYFGDEIEAVRQRNHDESVRQLEILERAKEQVAEELASRQKSRK